jgi:hypothetical protein
MEQAIEQGGLSGYFISTDATPKLLFMQIKDKNPTIAHQND